MARVEGRCFQLPVEIWDDIIGYIRDNYEALANCSLVCRALSPTCRIHRFREVKVNPRSVGRPQTASLLCDPTSTVLPYVHRLVLIEGLPETDLDREERHSITLDPAVGSTAYWLDNVLPEMRIRELTALKSLFVRAIQWESLSSSSRNSLVELCSRLHSLEVITWEASDIPRAAVIELLCAATLLKHFALRLPEQIFTPPPDPDKAPSQRADAPPTLMSVELDNTVGWCSQALLLHFSALHITKASLRGVGLYDVKGALSFLVLSSASLQHLSLELDDPWPIWGQLEGVSSPWAVEYFL